jgi:hypothetical protein
VAGREGKRGECQTRLVYVWRETGAVRNARPSRGQAATHPEEGGVGKDGVAFRLRTLEVYAVDGLACWRRRNSRQLERRELKQSPRGHLLVRSGRKD